MPPRYKFTREEILKTALNIARKKGIESVTARAVGAELGASSKVIFSLFGNMQTLHEELIKAAYSLYWQFVKEDTASGKYLPYKASGMAYIRFAKEETELFKLLFMRDRSDEASTSVVADKDDLEMENIYRIISKANGFSLQQAKLLHLEMWIYVHGIATMLATSYMPFECDFISDLLTDAYEGIRMRIARQEEK